MRSQQRDFLFKVAYLIESQAARIEALEGEVKLRKPFRPFNDGPESDDAELGGAAITDAAVERACAAHWQAKYPNDTRYPNGWPADSLDTDWAEERRKWMRASLEAAFSESHQASAEG